MRMRWWPKQLFVREGGRSLDVFLSFFSLVGTRKLASFSQTNVRERKKETFSLSLSLSLSLGGGGLLRSWTLSSHPDCSRLQFRDRRRRRKEEVRKGGMQ